MRLVFGHDQAPVGRATAPASAVEPIQDQPPADLFSDSSDDVPPMYRLPRVEVPPVSGPMPERLPANQ